MNINEKLIKAVIADQIENVRELLDLGADIHSMNDFALSQAAFNGHTKIVELLLDHGADIHAEGEEGPDTALQFAAMRGHTDTVRLLLDRGAEIHSVDGFDEPEGALLDACEYGHADTVALLLDYGADIHTTDYMGPNAPLRRAAGNGHHETVKMLLERGADIPKEDNHVLCAAAEAGSVETVSLLLDWGQYRESQPELSLVVLATIGDHREVDALLKQSIDHLALDLALRRAAPKGHVETVALLLVHGASIRGDDDEALQGAALHGHSSIVAMLLGRYKNFELLEVRADTKATNLLLAIHAELQKRQMMALRKFYRGLPEMEI